MIEQPELQRSAAQQIDDIDGQIAKLQDDKKAVYDALKEALPPATNKAWKAAVKLRQKRRDGLKRAAMEEHDALVFEILSVLEAPVAKTKKASGTAVATRTGAGAENSDADGHDPVTGEITETPSTIGLGLLSNGGAAGEGAVPAPAAINPETPQGDPPVPDLAGEVTGAVPPATAPVTNYTDEDMDTPPFLQRGPANEVRAA